MKAKKKFGQNFLNNDTIIKQIVSLFNFNKNDLIIEIGPGRGALTKELFKENINVLCIEIDTDMHVYLDKYENSKLHVIYDDILNIDLNKLINKQKYSNIYVIGNLPYYITSPIMEMLIKSKIKFSKMVFMVQKEVADRYSSLPNSKNYGYMTVFLNHYYDVKKEIDVPKNNFNPVPKVDSSVISLNYKDSIAVSDDYWNFVKLVFHLKRKNIRNNLKTYDLSKIEKVLNKYSLDLNVRAESLNEEILLDIYNTLKTD